MLHSKAFVKKTRGGKVVKVVKEHYLRDDIACGSPLCRVCDRTAARLGVESTSQYLVVDTNVVLQQMDFLEHAAIEDVIVLSIVLEEAKHRNTSTYNRLRALIANPQRRFFVFANEHHKETYITPLAGESPNDRNDRAIRVATAWYEKHLPGRRVLLITNDVDNARRAREEGVSTKTVLQYAASRKDVPELVDLVAGAASAEQDGNAEPMDVDNRPNKKRILYEEARSSILKLFHKPMSEITAGLRAGKYHQGSLRVNPYNSYEAYVGSDSVGHDILIRGREPMNRAINGDIVAVELLPESQWLGDSTVFREAHEEDEESEENRSSGSGGSVDEVTIAPTVSDAPIVPRAGKRPTGRVVGILKRNWRPYCGSIEPPGKGGGATQAVLFMSVERSIPKIRIHTKQAESLADKRIVVSIDTWDRTSMYPSGHYVRTLGKIGDRETETEVLLIENDINTRPFAPAVMECVPPLPWSVPAEAYSDPKRKDLRDILVFSVDPPGCKDIDDALHLQLLPGGNYSVGVHIADVTNFVLPGTAMDTEASERGTSVYLVERRIDMLPKALTEDICSLRADVERFAFSVLWEMTPDGHILDTSFTKSIIRSNHAFSYAEAQARMDDARLSDDTTMALRRMNAVAKILRQRRVDRGALTLASPEVKFEVDTETLDPLDVGMYQVREANQMVEEFMLLANITVAEKVLQHFPACSLLRRHPTPTPQMFEPLLKAARAIGINLDVENSKVLAESLDQAQMSDGYFNKMIRILATRCMTQAVYFASGDITPPEMYHYGLATPLYTHFTSPIRRYADVVVHRLLAASIQLEALYDRLRDRNFMRELCNGINVRHRNAQMAGRASVQLHTLIFFRNKSVDADARVIKVRTNGIIVFVPKYGIEGPIYVTPHAKSKGEAAVTDDFTLDEERQTVVSKDGKIAFRVFDTLTINISVQEPQPNRPKLMLALTSTTK
eukprot:jgi/Chlat1/8934/Chrsp94S08251